MLWRSLRHAILMLGGALISVETLVLVLEHRMPTTSVDPSFYVEMQQTQTAARLYAVSQPGRGLGAPRTP